MIETGKGHYYYLDLDKINDWVFINKSNKNDFSMQRVYMPYDDEEDNTEDESKVRTEELTEKVVETESSPKEYYSAIRYEMIKDMFNSLFTLGAESDNEGIKFIQEIEELGIANKLILNTFMENKFMLDKLEVKKKK